MTTTKITKIEDFTPEELMRAVLLWCYNWTKEDFKQAFKDSKLGWDYQWDKLQDKLSRGNDATSAIVDVILSMDLPHQKMLLDFLYAENEKTVRSSREWNEVMDSMETE